MVQKSGECYSSSRNIAEVTCLECLRIAADKALDPLNCIKPEWHERQQQANEVQRYIRITNATVDLGEKPIGEWVPFNPPDDSPELAEDAETIPFDPETMEIRDDGCVAYKEEDQDPPKTGYSTAACCRIAAMTSLCAQVQRERKIRPRT